MGLLDGGIKQLFGTVFGGIYLDGTLHTGSFDVNSMGDVSSSPAAAIPIKVQVEECTENMRKAEGYSADDVALIVLQDGIGIVPTSDHEITARGVRYRLNTPITADPAGSHWIIRGTHLA